MSTGSNKIVKTVTIKPGENFVLPQGANVTTVIGTISSNGCTIPAPTTLQCYTLVREESSGSGATLGDAFFTEIILDGGNLVFKLPNPQYNGSDLNTAINNLSNPLVKATCYRDENLSSGSNYIAKFEFPKFTILPRLKLVNPASSTPGGVGQSVIYLEMQESTDCETC